VGGVDEVDVSCDAGLERRSARASMRSRKIVAPSAPSLALLALKNVEGGFGNFE
jgi:hypothetical protein